MNFFGIGGAELVLIFLIMLMVAGPKRMIRWAYILGVYVGKARGMWKQIVAVMQAEIDEAGLDIKLPTEPPTRQNMSQVINSALKPLSQPLEDTLRETQQVMKEAKDFSPKGAESPAPSTPPSSTETNPSFGSWSSTSNPAPSNSADFGSWSVPKSDKEN